MRVMATIAALFLTSCTLGLSQIKKPESMARYLDKIEAFNQQVIQVKATLDIKAVGIMGSFVHEQADIIIRAPKYIYWSLRSFFGPPSLILASNGEFITVYDYGFGLEPYQKITLRDDSFFELMDFSLHPFSIINLFLVKIPLEGAYDIKMGIRKDELEIEASLHHGWHLKSVYDLARDQLITTYLKNQAMSVSYQATYADYQDVLGTYFPKSIVFLSKGKSRFAKFNIKLLAVELNGELVLPDTFYLKPH